MSENLLSTILTVVGTLVITIIGGLITFVIMHKAENLKWQQERREKIMGLERDALAKALEWIEPLRNAEIHASSLVMAAIRGEIEDEHFLMEFPHVLGELAKNDLSASQRALLPETYVQRSIQIVRDLDELRYLGVKYGQEARVKGKPFTGFQECNIKLEAILQQINDLEIELGKAFRRTFE